MIWNLFQVLVEQGLIDPECLTVPVNLYHSTNDTQLITELLYCLKNVRLDSDLVRNIALQSCGFYTDIEWYVLCFMSYFPLLRYLLLTTFSPRLATMIVRSGADLKELLQAIVNTDILGQCDDEELSLFNLVHPNAQKIEKHERDREGEKNADGSVPNLFGFWLSHGLSTDPETRTAEIASCMQRFEEIEEAFCALEGEEAVSELIGP